MSLVRAVACCAACISNVRLTLRQNWCDVCAAQCWMWRSPTYGRYVSCLMTQENHRQFFIPRGFAHGFAVLSDTAVFQYKCDNYYCPEADGGISILDPSLGIEWQIDLNEAILSEKDKKHPLLKDFDSPFSI